MKYHPEIDGLRAVAVLAVVFFHAGQGFHGGFTGVDVFFVISGFLITGLIQKELDSGGFSIINFWERRIRRILPALSVVVVSVMSIGWFVLLPTDYASLGKSIGANAIFGSNILFWQTSGYFDKPAEANPLLHLWSLAVEEQFYLIFPFFLLFIGSFGLARRRLGLVLLFAVFSLGASIYCSYKHPSANFHLLSPRAWELLLGALVVFIPELPLITGRHRFANE